MTPSACDGEHEEAPAAFVSNVRGGACAETDVLEEQLLIEQSKCY